MTDLDDRNDNFECDECGKMSALKWKPEIDDDTLESLHADNWAYSEGVLLCDECADVCRVN
jgi:hypothetical protein